VHDLGLDPGGDSIPATPAMTPRRAVFGSFIQLSEKINSAVATIAAS